MISGDDGNDERHPKHIGIRPTGVPLRLGKMVLANSANDILRQPEALPVSTLCSITMALPFEFIIHNCASCYRATTPHLLSAPLSIIVSFVFFALVNKEIFVQLENIPFFGEM